MIKNINLIKILTIPINNKINIENVISINNELIIIIIYIRLLLKINLHKSLTEKLNKKKIILINNFKKDNLKLKNKICYFLYKIKLYYLKNKFDSKNILINYFVSKLNNTKLVYINNINYYLKKNFIIDIYSFIKNKIIYKYIKNFKKINLIKFIYKKIYLKKNNLFKKINLIWLKIINKIDLNSLIKVIYNIWKNNNMFIINIINIIKKKFFYKKNINNKIKIIDIINIHKNNINYINNIKYKISSLTLIKFKLLINKYNINKRIYNKKNIINWYNKLFNWINSKTDNYKYPKCLIYFSQTFINNLSKKSIPKIISLLNIDLLLNKNFLIKEKIINYTLKNIFYNKIFLLNKFKYKIFINYIKKYININNNNLDKKYPIIILNIQKYNKDIKSIINLIFKKNLLILINNNYYKKFNILLKNNYRIIINDFVDINLSKQIRLLFNKYYKLKFKFNNKLLLNNKNYFKKNIYEIGLQYLIYNTGTNISTNNYINIMSQICSNKINYLLYKNKIKKSDIIIIVNNDKECNKLQSNLDYLNIPSIYFTMKNSIYNSIEAIELYNILKAIIYPNNKLFYKILFLHKKLFFKKKKNIFNFLIKCNKLWDRYGISIIIIYYLKKHNPFIYSLSKNIIFFNNLLFLISKLIKKEILFYNDKFNLLLWFKSKIFFSNKINNYYKYDFLKFKNYIKIINFFDFKNINNTYKICFLPFICNINKISINYFIKKLFNIFNKIKKTIYLCIAPIIINNKDINVNIYNSNLKNTLIGNLILKNKNVDNIELNNFFYKQKKKKNLNFKINNIYYVKKIKKKFYKNSYKLFKKFKKKYIFFLNKKYIYKEKKNIIVNYNYSNLKNKIELINKKDLYNLNFYKIKKNKNIIKYKNIHNFPKGIITGLFCHKILSNINKNNFLNIEYLYKQIIIFNIDIKWFNFLKNWFFNIKNYIINFNNIKINLSKILTKNKLVEFKFDYNISYKLFLYLIENNFYNRNIYNNNINISKIFFLLNKLNIKINKYMNIINGIIDLIFFYNNKYYIIDYKSNWLGSNIYFYKNNNIIVVMNKYKYFLQIILYTLALNKFLKQKFNNYNYINNFGGIFFLFIRGLIFNKINNNGIFFNKLDYNIINKLDII